jgi:hypothetical protein
VDERQGGGHRGGRGGLDETAAVEVHFPGVSCLTDIGFFSESAG